MKKVAYTGDLCVIKSPSNLFYLTGYDNADAIIVLVGDKSYYFTDARYFEEVKVLENDFIICKIADFSSFIENGGYKTASVESTIDIKLVKQLEKCGVSVVDFCDKSMADLRAIKSESEIAKMISAQEITDRVFEKILSCIEVGMTERSLASKLEAELYANGADGLAFTSIVAFGENTSKPHAHRSDKKLEKGMPITLDFGAKFGGFCSDMTRTFFMGKPDTELSDTYKLVLDAQQYALANIKSGMTGKECDELARSYFRKYGQDKYFVHSLGHSLGIDCHESPNFSPRCDEIINQGMVLSVEPGLYYEGKYGVRIEDVIYFGENGIINLTKSPKNMIIL